MERGAVSWWSSRKAGREVGDGSVVCETDLRSNVHSKTLPGLALIGAMRLCICLFAFTLGVVDALQRKKNKETTDDEKRLLDSIKRKEREALERERCVLRGGGSRGCS